MDILFMIDGRSTSYTFAKQKNYVKLLARRLGVSAGRSRAAGLTYGFIPLPFHSFNDFNNLQNFENATDRARMATGELRIDRALFYAKNMFSSARPTVPKILILFTANKQSPSSGSLEQAIQPIRKLGVQTYIISIGDKPNPKALRRIVTSNDDIIRVTSADLLENQLARTKNKLIAGLKKISLLCLVVYSDLFFNRNRSIIIRSELLAKCGHANKFIAANYKPP